MTISKRVQKELVQATPGIVTKAERTRANKIKASREARAQREAIAARTKGQAWTKEEHERFLEALQVYPSGPWEAVAEYVGTKNSRQTMTHAQKYRQKHERQQRGLRASVKPTKSTKTTTARRAAQPYEPRAAVKNEKQLEVEIATTPLPELRVTDVESPRSGEEEYDQLLPPIDMDLFSSSVSSAPSTKADNARLLEQLFMDFDPQLTLQAHMWSTNSLMDDAPMDALVLDELSALPEELSQSLGMWVP